MKTFIKILLSFAFCMGLAFAPMFACSPHGEAKSGADGVDRGLAVAFAGGVGALAVADHVLAEHMAAMPSATPEQLAKLQAQVDRLKRAREALATVRKYVAGEAVTADPTEQLRDVLKLLDQVSAELRADGVKVPPDVETGLRALSAFLVG